MVERSSLSMLPHAVVQISSYAYVEFSLLLNYVNKPVIHRTSMQTFDWWWDQFSRIDWFLEAGTDSIRFAQDKLTSGLGMPQEPENKSPTLGALFSGSPGCTAVRTTYHHYFLRDSSKLQVAHNPHYLSIKSRFGCRDHIYEDSRRFVFKRNSSGLNLLWQDSSFFSVEVPRTASLMLPIANGSYIQMDKTISWVVTHSTCS